MPRTPSHNAQNSRPKPEVPPPRVVRPEPPELRWGGEEREVRLAWWWILNELEGA